MELGTLLCYCHDTPKYRPQERINDDFVLIECRHELRIHIVFQFPQHLSMCRAFQRDDKYFINKKPYIHDRVQILDPQLS